MLRIDSIIKTRVLFSILVYFISFGVCNGQTFSVIVTNAYTSLNQNVVLTDYGYLTAGTGYDTIDGEVIRPLSIRGYDFFGELIYTKKYYSEDWIMSPIFDANCRINDSAIVVAGEQYFEENDTNYTCLFWINNNGDTVQTKKYLPPLNYDNYCRPTAMVCSEDGQYIYFVASTTISPPIQNNFLIKKLTAQGNEVWTYINPISPYYYTTKAITERNDSLFFIKSGGGGDNYPIITCLNGNDSNVLFEHELDGDTYVNYGVTDFILNFDNHIIASSLENNVDYHQIPLIYEMDFEGNYIWHTIPNEGTYEQQQYADHLAQAQDGGYVSCSIKYEEIPSVTNPGDPSDNNTNSLIWLWKVDANGVLQWERTYEYLSFDSLNYYHIKSIAHDFKATPDGGFIAAGEASANCSDYPICDHFTQQGWLLKVDGCGCLVPGCDINCTVGIDDSGRHPELVSGSLFLVGPNPARDMLNVYLSKISNVQLSTLNIQVHDLQGKLVGSFALKHDDTTYMIDTTSLAAGQYVVSLVSEGIVLQTEQIIIAK